MRVLFLAYHFPPIGGGGVQRNAKFVRYLSAFGYSPVVVTGPGGARDRWTPEDETLLTEIPAGTRIRRVPGPEPGISTGARAALERRLMLPTPFVRWWTQGAIAVGSSEADGTSLIYGSLVPYETTHAAAALARLLDKPWVADLQDPWALDEMWLYPTGLHRSLDLRKMRRHLLAADAVVMNTPEAAKRVQQAFPELAERIVVSIPNGYDASDFDGPEPDRDGRIFRIVHAGYLHTQTGLRLREVRRARRILGGMTALVDILPRSHVYLLQAIERLIESQPALSARIEVVLAGVTNPIDVEIAEKSPVTVRFPGYATHAETIALMRSSDLLFLPMHDLPIGHRAGLVPGKTYEYMASRKPILAAVPDGDARELLEEAGSAFLCRPTDVSAMTKIISERFDSWEAGEPGPEPRPEVLQRYERRELTRQLAAVFDRLVGRSVSGERKPAPPERSRTRSPQP